MKKFSLLLIVLLITACTGTGKPRDVVADRDVCTRCGMQLNDLRFVAQAVHKTNGSNFVFIEMGCAIIWLEANGKENYTLYLTDLKRPGKWLKAEEAVLTVDYATPMSYGVAAIASEADLEEGKSIISYDEAIQRIFTLDQARQKQRMGHM